MLNAKLYNIAVAISVLTKSLIVVGSPLPANVSSPNPNTDISSDNGQIWDTEVSVPSRPTAGHLPRRTLGPETTMTVVDSGPTDTPSVTHAPNPKRGSYNMPAEEFLTSLVDLYSKYAVASDSASVASELTSLFGYYKPESTDSDYAARVTASLKAITVGGEGQLDEFTSAASKSMSEIIADNYYTFPRYFQGYDTVTYRSLTAFLSIWKGLNPAERESFTHYNTFAGTWAPASWAQSDIVTTAGFTTWWQPTYWQNQVHSLATIDDGMAQIYWTKNNVVETIIPTPTADISHKSGSGSSATSITTLEQDVWSSAVCAASGTAAVAAFTSLNTYSADESAGGGATTTTLEEQAYLSSVSSLSAASSTSALESFTSLNTYSTAGQGGQENNNGVTNDGNQQFGVGTGLPHCPTYTPSVGDKYIACGGPTPDKTTSVQATTECPACDAMNEPYDKTKS